MLFHWDDAVTQLRGDLDHELSNRAPAAPRRWADAVKTGDALADEWEAAVSRGEVPDMDRKQHG